MQYSCGPTRVCTSVRRRRRCVRRHLLRECRRHRRRRRCRPLHCRRRHCHHLRLLFRQCVRCVLLLCRRRQARHRRSRRCSYHSDGVVRSYSGRPEKTLHIDTPRTDKLTPTEVRCVFHVDPDSPPKAPKIVIVASSIHTKVANVIHV